VSRCEIGDWLPREEVNPTLVIPAYHQVAEALIRAITASSIRPGGRLPTETALAGHYGLSRNTIRQALRLLERKRLITRQRGSGTFLTERPSSG
jgi:GntR family transcriptional regulator